MGWGEELEDLFSSRPYSNEATATNVADLHDDFEAVLGQDNWRDELSKASEHFYNGDTPYKGETFFPVFVETEDSLELSYIGRSAGPSYFKDLGDDFHDNWSDIFPNHNTEDQLKDIIKNHPEARLKTEFYDTFISNGLHEGIPEEFASFNYDISGVDTVPGEIHGPGLENVTFLYD